MRTNVAIARTLGPPIREPEAKQPDWIPIPGQPHWFVHTSMKAEDGSPCKKYAPPPPVKRTFYDYMGPPIVGRPAEDPQSFIDHTTEWFGVTPTEDLLWPRIYWAGM